MNKKRRGKYRLVQVREPSGRPSRTEELREHAPTSIKRLRDAAIAGMADPEWGTALGQLFLAQKIDGAMYTAGKRWGERAQQFYSSIGAPPIPRAIDLDGRSFSHPPDPDSPEGARQSIRDTNARTEFMAAHAVLIGAGKLAEANVRALCEDDEMPVGIEGMIAVKSGLRWLAQFWGLTNHVKNRNGR